MKLTPLDIHHKEFRRAIRGYNEEEVDVFLDQVAAEFERVFKENIEQKERFEKINEKLKQYEGIEQTLQKALLTAQKAADEVQNNAQKESDLIIKDAELKAKEMIQQILSEKQALEGDLGSLRNLEIDFKTSFKGMLNKYLDGIGKVEKGERLDSGGEPDSGEGEQEAPKELLTESDEPALESDAKEEKNKFNSKPEDNVQKETDNKPEDINAQQIKTEARPAEEETKRAVVKPDLNKDKDEQPQIGAETEKADYVKHESAPEVSTPTQNEVEQNEGGPPSSGYKIPEYDVTPEHPDLEEPSKSGADGIKPASEWPDVVTEQPQKTDDPNAAGGKGAFKVTLGNPAVGAQEEQPSADPGIENKMDNNSEIPKTASDTISELDSQGDRKSVNSQNVSESVSSFFDDDLGVDEEEKNTDPDENSSDNNPPL